MTHLLDTDISIFWLRGNTDVVRHVSAVGWDQIGISVITVAELLYGAYNSSRPEREIERVERFTDRCRIFPLDMLALHRYGELKVSLQRRGEKLADLDLMIASTDLAGHLTLVTNNLKHYLRIPSLTLQNWLQP